MPKLPSSNPNQAFAVLMEDEFYADGAPVEVRITVKKVIGTQWEAEQEVKRLVLANKHKNCRYFWQRTKMEGLGEMREKIQTYEGLLHDIQMFAEVALRGDLVSKLIMNICSWSYAHRVGNGELSEVEQDRIIKRAFNKLRDKGDQKEIGKSLADK